MNFLDCLASIAYAKKAVDDYVLGIVQEFSEPPNPPKIPEDSLDFIYFSIFDFRARYGFDLQRIKKRVARQQVKQPFQVVIHQLCTHLAQEITQLPEIEKILMKDLYCSPGHSESWMSLGTIFRIQLERVMGT